MIPPLFKSIFFSLFVFTIGYKSGPEFFASLSIRTLSQVGVALVIGFTGLAIVLAFAFIFRLDAGTAAGLAAGSLTQSSMIGRRRARWRSSGLPTMSCESSRRMSRPAMRSPIFLVTS